MAKNPQNYRTNKEKRLYIEECERRFDAEVDRAIRLITETDGLEIVTLSWPSCSGKTTTAKKLICGVEAVGVALTLSVLMILSRPFRNRLESFI